MSKCQSFKIQILKCAKTRVGMLNSRRLLQTNKPGDPHFLLFQTFFLKAKKSQTKLKKILSKEFCTTRSHNRGRRPQARGPRKTIEKDKCAIFSENCATLNVINSRGYTQICVGPGDSPQIRLAARLEGSTHTIEKSFN